MVSSPRGNNGASANRTIAPNVWPNDSNQIKLTNENSTVLIDVRNQVSSMMGSAQTQASSKLTTGAQQAKFPMSGQEAAKILAPYLFEFEKKEILEQETVYFFNI